LEHLDSRLRAAIEGGLTCDITTIGRRSGQPRRIEIWYFVVDGRIYLTGTPGSRDWYANLLADPHLTMHVKEGARADLPAVAAPVTEPAERRRVIEAVMTSNSWFREQQYDVGAWVAGSPLVELTLLPGG
jgi:deazaflavin-dependent oxidoreductase (nitroreductase family)